MDFPVPQVGGEVENNGATVLNRRLYSTNVEDNYLHFLLCLFGGQYVTWVYNAQTGGCNNGHYFGDNLEKAMADFKSR